MIDVGSVDPYKHELSVAQVHKRVVNAVELQSARANAPPLLSNFLDIICRSPRMYYVSVSVHRMPNTMVISLDGKRWERNVVALVEGGTLQNRQK